MSHRFQGLFFFRQLLSKEIRSRFLGVASGWIWVLLNPLMLLMVYALVFGVIFKARVPQGLEIPFIAWLAIGLWPWLAFSEGILRGAQSIHQHSALIAKVAIPRALLTLSTHTAAFLLQLVGYSVVILVLLLTGVDLHLSAIPYVFMVLVTLYLFSFGLALFFSATCVFLRDLDQLLPTILLLWFFLTPILYSPELLPIDLGQWLNVNPMTWWMQELRSGLLYGKSIPDTFFLVLLGMGMLSVLMGFWIFNRLSPHFEDFL